MLVFQSSKGGKMRVRDPYNGGLLDDGDDTDGGDGVASGRHHALARHHEHETDLRKLPQGIPWNSAMYDMASP